MTSVNKNLTSDFKRVLASAATGLALAVAAAPVLGQAPQASGASAAEAATYADLATLSERSELVIRAQIRRQSRVKDERSPGLAPGFARLYIEADTLALIAGSRSVGESLAYLVDVPLDAKGKVPKLKKREVLLFANVVPGRPGSIQLAAKAAQFDYAPELEARLRPILRELVAADRPPTITGIADALAVQGTLTGESETQVFLASDSGAPVSLSVIRRPGQRPAWGVSWGEIIDSSARPPAPQTLRWYRLACALPAQLPSSANLARDPAARRLAAQDYAFVMEQLGPCSRRITEPA
ncbi:hypothetical protein [Erythrobacter sp. JK5]|uniref:hypothetical protein n=1 Tax=Erythrobacter sp. JK5 TaxID=2829500 RepID=UPI001BAC9DE2|nr:hypothetical protein [Erythrobacter sp. JK5]QUL37456.1 hypothetical protein KDC96_14030 [Erythrobacter sp. JK5]